MIFNKAASLISGRSLKPIFMVLTALIFILSALGVSWSVRTLAEGIIETWAPMFIAKQALYDKSRTLQPILREVALSRQLASSGFIRDWARHPEDPDLTRNALVELEQFRKNFQDQSYFVAFLSNGRYYHNNAANAYAGKEFRYVLDPGKKEDSWFYDIIRQEREIHINVNPDLPLGITKLWIDVLIRDNNDILGMAGTGLDLTRFLDNVVKETDPGVTSLFVDHAGAIQLHRDKSFIDFGSVSKQKRARKTIDLIFTAPGDRVRVSEAMKALEAGKKTVDTLFADVQGRRHLAGIVYLPEIDWYEITLIDLAVLMPLSHFSTILLVFIISLLITLVLFNFALNRLVLTPLGQLDRAMAEIEAGKNPGAFIRKGGRGEIRRLIRRFMQMADSVLESRHHLETKVKERTAALEHMAKADPLTGLYNRRGMGGLMTAALNRACREQARIGMLWIDIDWFKEINDTHGHAIGDEALISVARVIQSVLRPYDLAARWGGDEFLVLLQPADSPTLDQIGERLCNAVSGRSHTSATIKLSVSIGGSLSRDNQEMGELLQDADQALYQAKKEGRNRYVRA